mmetsp:Transcript_76274/g.134632  ORF Transcript_76274/g.134632 Transcript_76274/m.134632 type:complete len:81 (+) Transcript_76274:779-1021(+)
MERVEGGAYHKCGEEEHAQIAKWGTANSDTANNGKRTGGRWWGGGGWNTLWMSLQKCVGVYIVLTVLNQSYGKSHWVAAT